MIWWIIATLCAFFIKGLCGFANTLIFNTILSFENNNINISPIELILGYPSNFIIAWKKRKQIQWKICLPLSALVLAGSIPGMFLLKNADTHAIKIFFGFVIVAVGAEMLFREMGKRTFGNSKVVLVLIGILSGVLCGLYGIGALLGAFVNRVTDDSDAFKGNICFVFIIENTFRLVLYAYLGILTAASFTKALTLAPFMLFGLFAGMWSSRLLNEKMIRKAVIVMLMVSGAALIMNNL